MACKESLLVPFCSDPQAGLQEGGPRAHVKRQIRAPFWKIQEADGHDHLARSSSATLTGGNEAIQPKPVSRGGSRRQGRRGGRGGAKRRIGGLHTSDEPIAPAIQDNIDSQVLVATTLVNSDDELPDAKRRKIDVGDPNYTTVLGADPPHQNLAGDIPSQYIGAITMILPTDSATGIIQGNDGLAVLDTALSSIESTYKATIITENDDGLPCTQTIRKAKLAFIKKEDTMHRKAKKASWMSYTV